MGYQQGPPQQGPPQGQGGWQNPQQQPGQPQQGWQPGQQQQGPPQGYGDPYAQQQGQGYAPFQGGQPMGGGAGGYDWGTLYGQADHSVSQLIPAGLYTAIVKSSDWDRTKDGTKGAWTITFILTNGPRIGMKQVFTMAVSPKTNKGEDNPEGMGRMFRQLASMGIPVPPPYGQQGWWEMGWNEQQVGQAMVGRPVLLQLTQDEYEGVTRNKVRDVQPPPPGAPTQMPQITQQQPQGPPQGFAPPQGQQWQAPPQQAPQPGGAPAPWQGQQQQPQQPQFEGQGYGQGFGQQQQGPPQGQQQGPPPGYQGQQQQGPPAGYQQPPGGYDPSVPPYAQQANPGAPGAQQFTQQGQAWQPGVNPAQEQQAAQQMQQGQQPPQQQPWANPNGAPGQQQQGYAPQGQQPQQGGEQGPPQAPGWAGGQQ